jgi:hypothetical protein
MEARHRRLYCVSSSRQQEFIALFTDDLCDDCQQIKQHGTDNLITANNE